MVTHRTAAKLSASLALSFVFAFCWNSRDEASASSNNVRCDARSFEDVKTRVSHTSKESARAQYLMSKKLGGGRDWYGCSPQASRFSPRERDRDGRRGCSDGDSTKSPRSLRCAHDDEIYTRDLRGRPQDRGSIRSTAYMLGHRGDHAGGKRIILVSNGAKLEWRRRASD
jgi:hypothetical protein